MRINKKHTRAHVYRTVLSVLAIIGVVSGGVYIYASDGYTVNNTSTVQVTGPDGVCKKVTNNSGIGVSEYIPTASIAEWQSFYNHPPAGVTVASCCAPSNATYGYTGGNQSYVVPAGVTSIHVDAYGAGGGPGKPAALQPSTYPYALGSNGGYTGGDINVTPGETLTVLVGQAGVAEGIWSGTFGGGGAGGNSPNGTYGGSGGGMSSIIRGGTDLLVAAGGGGGMGRTGYTESSGNGGGGGGLNGNQGWAGHCFGACPQGGFGGTQSAGGAGGYSPGASGSAGGYHTGGIGGYGGGGGGGGGYFGGGGGSIDGGGGGGSGYCGSASSCVSTAGAGMGDEQSGQVTVTTICS